MRVDDSGAAGALAGAHSEGGGEANADDKEQEREEYHWILGGHRHRAWVNVVTVLKKRKHI